MQKYLICFGLTAVLVFSFGCAKKKTGGGETAGPAAGGDIAKFDEGTAAFRETIRYVSLERDKAKAAEAAAKAEASFGEVAQAWPKDPPDRYEADSEWANRIITLRKLMGDIKTQSQADKIAEAEASILEAQKLLLALDERNKINSAGDEIIRILIRCDEMDVAFREKRYNDMKHIMPNMREAQKNFFGSPMPPSANGREDAFDKAKDEVYEGVDTFAEATNPADRETALLNLKKAARKFYAEFG